MGFIYKVLASGMKWVVDWCQWVIVGNQKQLPISEQK